MASVGGLAALNALVELGEQAGVVDTHRPDDRVMFQEGAPYVREGDDWVTAPDLRGGGIQRFPATKGSRWRMFVLGGSFALGTPFGCCREDGSEKFGGIPTWLRSAAAVRWPGAVDVITAAEGGINSGRVRQIAQQVVQHDADAIFLASCNNEGVLAPSLARERLHGVGGYRLLNKLLKGAEPPGERAYFMPQDPDSAALRAQFRRNIERTVKSAEQRGVHVFLATLPINLRYRGPEAGHVEVGPDVRGQGACRAVDARFRQGRLEEAIEAMRGCPGLEDVKSWTGLALLRLGRVEEGRAELEQWWGACVAEGVALHYAEEHEAATERLATCPNEAEAMRWAGLSWYALGEHALARAALEQSVEVLPRNRCRPSYNALLREIAAAHDHVTLVDLEEAASAASPGGIPGPELFWDYCHMTSDGYRAMARELDRVLAASPAGPGPSASLPDWDALTREHAP